ncbi:MAG: MnhB domain-containing protein [Gammaproteobacteria bacterium]
MIRAHDSIIVRTLSRLLIPLVQLYAIYILFFGQYSPGGGFAAGGIFGASLILAVLVFSPDNYPGAVARKVLRGDGFGLVVFVGVGGLCLIGGGEFLNYAALEIPGLSQPARRSLGIVLTQIGVGIDIAVTAVSIVFSLSFIAQNEASSD